MNCFTVDQETWLGKFIILINLSAENPIILLTYNLFNVYPEK